MTWCQSIKKWEVCNPHAIFDRKFAKRITQKRGVVLRQPITHKVSWLEKYTTIDKLERQSAYPHKHYGGWNGCISIRANRQQLDAPNTLSKMLLRFG